MTEAMFATRKRTAGYLCAALTLGLLAFIPARAPRSHRAPAHPAHRLAKVAAGAFTVDTCTDKQKLLDRLDNKAAMAGLAYGTLTLAATKVQSGLYENFPVLEGNSFPDGMMLSTGYVTDAKDGFVDRGSTIVDDNTADPKAANQRKEIIDIARATSANEDTTSDEKYSVFDPASFKVKFTTTEAVKSFSVDFVYGSAEFPDFLYSPYNDVFLIFLDGKNIAFDTKGKAISVGNNFFKVVNTAVTLDSGKIVRDTNATEDFINDNIRIEGFTPPLRAQENLKPGTHTLEFVIADISDPMLNSFAFLSNLRFSPDTVVPGLTLKADLIADQGFTAAETLAAGAEIGTLATLVPKAGLTFSVLSGVPEIALDAATGRLTVAAGGSLSKYRDQDVVLKVIAKQDLSLDTAKVTVHVQGVNTPPPPPPPPPVLLSVAKAVYLDSNGDGRIDQARIEFAAAPARAPQRVRLQDPFLPGDSVDVTGAAIVRLDSTHFRLDFPAHEFTFGTGVAAGPYGRITAADSLFVTAPFAVGDGVGTLPLSADAIGPQKHGDKPTLTLVFSEATVVDEASKAFPYDIKREGTRLTGITVESIRDLGGGRILYTFSSADYPLPGDSLRLQSGTPAVTDGAGNRSRMAYFIPVTGKLPVPPAVFVPNSTPLVDFPPLAAPVSLPSSVFVTDSASGACLCEASGASPALLQLTGAVPKPGFLPHLMSIKIDAPLSYSLQFFSNLGVFVNRAQGEITEADLSKLTRDANGVATVVLYWWPVGLQGQVAGTGAYIARGTFITGGEAHVVSFIFGSMRQ